MRATMIVIVLKLLFIKENNIWRKRKKLVEKTVKDEF